TRRDLIGQRRNPRAFLPQLTRKNRGGSISARRRNPNRSHSPDSRRINMSARLSPRATAIVIFAFLIMCSSAFASTSSNATLHVNYGFVVTGSSAGNPIAAGGEIQFDGKGSVVGFETTSNNGTIGDELDFTGTYSLAASCNGSLAISPKSGSPSNFKLLS